MTMTENLTRADLDQAFANTLNRRGQNSHISSPWRFPENIEKLKNLWAEGHSATLIASQLGPGITRNSVISKAHRLGLASRATAFAVTRKEYKRGDVIIRGYTPGVIPVRPRRVGVANYVRPKPKPLPKPVPTFDRSHVLPFLDTGTDQCRWIVEEQGVISLACGAPTSEGASYCPHHSNIAYRGQSKGSAPRGFYKPSGIKLRTVGGGP